MREWHNSAGPARSPFAFGEQFGRVGNQQKYIQIKEVSERKDLSWDGNFIINVLGSTGNDIITMIMCVYWRRGRICISSQE